MKMEEGLDTGPVLLMEETVIGAEETAGELSARLAEMGGGLMVRTLELLERGEIEPRPQPADGVTYAARLTRDSGRVDWTLTARETHDRLLAYTPWPGLTAELREQPVKITAAKVLNPGAVEQHPGTILGLQDGHLAVSCGQGTILGIAELQRPGKRALRASDFVNGERLRPGEAFH
jgi:methionyl-tRNA formyltransferase